MTYSEFWYALIEQVNPKEACAVAKMTRLMKTWFDSENFLMRHDKKICIGNEVLRKHAFESSSTYPFI